MYMSVIHLESMRMTVAVVNALGMHLWQIDFVSAYLNSKLKHTVYMRPLPVFLRRKDKALHLKKMLYGLMQGSHNWWHNLNKAYEKLGYLMSYANSCVKYKQAAGEHIITDNYNDDILGTLTTIEGSRLAKRELGLKLGELNYILGVCFDKNPMTGNISLSQQAYLEHMLECFSF